jgi:hypothetical protein
MEQAPLDGCSALAGVRLEGQRPGPPARSGTEDMVHGIASKTPAMASIEAKLFFNVKLTIVE